jgi:outer membrane protein assembly factor BamE
MLNKIILLFVFSTPFILSACSSFSPYTLEIRQGNYIAPDARLKIKIGMSKQQVTAILGSPLINDVFHASRWDYVYRFEVKKILQEQQRYTVFFDGNFVIRIDDSDKGNSKPVEASLSAPSSK